MKNNLKLHVFVCAILGCLVVFTGCNKPPTATTSDTEKQETMSAEDAHAALHTPKYKEVVAEFPGHKYALEVINENEEEGLVAAFLTDAHFSPVDVDTQEVQLNFTADGAAKTFTLNRAEQDAGKPAKYTLQNKELSELICDGWKGDATASMEAGGNPFNAKMKKLSKKHDHNHGHSHGHGHDHDHDHGHSH